MKIANLKKQADNLFVGNEEDFIKALKIILEINGIDNRSNIKVGFITKAYAKLRLTNKKEQNDIYLNFIETIAKHNNLIGQLTLGKFFQYGNAFNSACFEKAEICYQNLIKNSNLEKTKYIPEALYNMALWYLERDIIKAQKYLIDSAKNCYIPAFKKLFELQNSGKITKESNAIIFNSHKDKNIWNNADKIIFACCSLYGIGMEQNIDEAVILFTELTFNFVCEPKLICFVAEYFCDKNWEEYFIISPTEMLKIAVNRGDMIGKFLYGKLLFLQKDKTPEIKNEAVVLLSKSAFSGFDEAINFFIEHKTKK